jgi:hypothetical protein
VSGAALAGLALAAFSWAFELVFAIALMTDGRRR